MLYLQFTILVLFVCFELVNWYWTWLSWCEQPNTASSSDYCFMYRLVHTGSSK